MASERSRARRVSYVLGQELHAMLHISAERELGQTVMVGTDLGP